MLAIGFNLGWGAVLGWVPCVVVGGSVWLI